MTRLPFPTAAIQTCGSCKGSFNLPREPAAHYVCPHCRAPVEPRSFLFQCNKNAATLALLSEAVLAVAVFLPFMSVVKLGQTETYSLVGGIGQLWQHGERALAMLIGAFSLVLPLVKNLFLLAATTSLAPLAMPRRHALHALAARTAKYSMLDVFVVAVIVVAVKLGETTEAVVRSGTFLFCLAIALSMAASACVRLGESHER